MAKKKSKGNKQQIKARAAEESSLFDESTESAVAALSAGTLSLSPAPAPPPPRHDVVSKSSVYPTIPSYSAIAVIVQNLT